MPSAFLNNLIFYKILTILTYNIVHDKGYIVTRLQNKFSVNTLHLTSD